jgi:cytochrome c oxidase cbb3-type subunit III
MKIGFKLAAGAVLLLTWLGAQSAVQGGGSPPIQGQRGARGGGRGGGNPNATFPAQQRPPGDPDLIARGNSLYAIHCRSCHGPDLRGGDQGGPNLLRSQLVLDDQAGERILPVVRDGLTDPGISPMPALGLPPDDVRAIAEYIHSIVATARGQGAPPPGPPAALNVLVGDANAGRAYFARTCAGCHSVEGDLKGIGARILNATQLQNTWVEGGAGGRSGGVTPVTATVTLQSGQQFDGQLARVDDFIIVLTLADGSSRSFRRDGDVPKIDIRDSREAHRKLLPSYTDKDIHDVTAYLVTLK